MKKSNTGPDPYLERERAKYGEALPSREHILNTLGVQGVPLEFEVLAALLQVSEARLSLLQRRLRAMERDGQLMRNRKGAICVVDKLGFVTGRIEGHPDGYGFLIPDGGQADLFLGAAEMKKALHGDRVAARETGTDRRGRREAAIVEILERVNRKVVGRLRVEHGVAYVVAEQKRISQDILLEPDGALRAKPGQVVVVEIIEQPGPRTQPIGRLTEVLGDYGDPGMEIEIALRKHDLPHRFPAAVVKAMQQQPAEVGAADFKGREDLRALPFITIDGETARDFDDAVYCEQKSKGFRLWVAIADVSHYVKPGSALDHEARLRGNSVYFPRRVIPMLPEHLSNGLCSLNPGVERLCVTCEMDIAADGAIKSHRFFPSVIHSAARLTYTEVAAALQGNPALRDLLKHLGNLHQLYQVLQKARWIRGAIDFETIETQMVFDAQGKIERIVAVHRNDAHRLIEECMLAANVCASEFLRANDRPTLYRIHQGPTAEKLANLREFLKGFGMSLSGGDTPHAKDYARLLERIKHRPDAQLLQTVMLRSLSQAVYSPENVGHFGLAYEAYTHFTSPIRRYPDLLVHRAIKSALLGRAGPGDDLHELGLSCSQTERRADEATRDVESWL
ncbi:MAG: ribonuclease R, partial [Burkholderiales bacterium]